MVKLITIKCPNCGANIEVNSDLEQYVCMYCGSSILIESETNKIRSYKNHVNNIDEKYKKISDKLNLILKFYIGSKNEMLLMLKDKIGLVNSNKTTSQYAMMQSSQSYVDEPFFDPFVYRIGDRTLDHFEYKQGGVVEVTYESDEDGFFALEYYGRITKYQDLTELNQVLDKIIEEVKAKFNS